MQEVIDSLHTKKSKYTFATGPSLDRLFAGSVQNSQFMSLIPIGIWLAYARDGFKYYLSLVPDLFRLFPFVEIRSTFYKIAFITTLS